MQSLWLIFIVFFLILLILPIFAKAYISFDFFNNLGAVSIYILFFKIMAYKIKYENKQIVVFTSKNQKEIEVEVSNKQLRFLKQLSVQLKQKIILKNVTFFSRIGLGDAFNTAIGTGLLNVVVSSFMGYVKNIKKSAKMKIINNPNYNGNGFMVSCVICCFITLFDLLYSIFMSLIIIKRSEKYERI